MATSKGYKTGYVNGGEREIIPFNPNPPTEETIERVVNVSSSGQLVTQNIVALNTSGDAELLSNGTFDQAPLVGGYMYITVNGITVLPAIGNSDYQSKSFYVTDSSGNTIKTTGTYSVGDKFWWNGSIAGYDIEDDDVVKLIYEI